MGIFFSLLYVLTAYLAPTTVFGALAEYHVEEIIIFFAVVASAAHISDSGIMKMPQTYGVLGMFVSVWFSLAFNGLAFTIPTESVGLLTSAISFFLVLLNFRTLLHIKLLVGTLVAAGLFMVYQGAHAVLIGDLTSPWVFMMGNGEGQAFPRIMGLGFIHDPNDFCQFLAGLIPCAFMLWRRGQFLFNLAVVLLPVSALLYGMFLTHSRGGMMGLLVALIVLGRRKFGIIPALVTGAVLFVALSAIGWSGGRDISAESGSDRMEAWSVGLTLIRTHPLFGVGFYRFADHFTITAHNSVVVCAAEIGVVGFFFWTLMVVPTVYEIIVAARGSKLKSGKQAEPQTAPAAVWAKAPSIKLPTPGPALLRMAFSAPGGKDATDISSSGLMRSARGVFPLPRMSKNSADDDEIRRLCGLMVVSLSGFFAAGWFLSRSYTMLVFVNIGLALAVHRLAVERGIAPPRLAFSRAAKYASRATFVLVATVYAMLRVTNLMPK